MSTIVTINSGDLITNSRADLNTNFGNLNTDKFEKSNIDTDTTLAANSDTKVASQKAVKAYVDAGGNVNASTSLRGIVQEATAAQVVSQTAVGSTGARLYVNPSTVSSLFKFGGTGADGALNVTSGTTTIALGAAAFVVKNYTSINVSSGATLTFSGGNANGTVVILKSQGAVTIVGTITGAALGATGGASVSGNDSTATGNNGNAGNSFALMFAGPTGGNGGSNTTPGSGGALLTAALKTAYFAGITSATLLKYPNLWSSGAGASGGAFKNSTGGSFTTGSGGNAGLTLLIECGGALNGTGTVNLSGANGGNASASGGQQSSAGGGGGAGGFFFCIYNTLTANSLTINVAGGTGGTSTFTSNVAAAGGGGGGSSLPTAGGAGSAVTSGVGGGAGAAGTSLVLQNSEFV